VAGVALEPAEAERRLLRHEPREREGGLAGGHAGAPVADVHVHEHAERDARGRRRAAQLGDVGRMIHDDHRVGRLAHEAHETPDRAGRHDLGGDQQPADARARHHLGLAELRAGDAERAGGDLTARDLGTLVGLGVGADRLAGAPRVPGHRGEVLLEAVEVEEQRGRRDLVAGHRRMA
jgi:hypothetical protein